METYLRELEESLHLDPDETRAIVAEVRGNLDDLAAHLQAQGYARDEAEREVVRRFDDARGLARALRWAHRGAPLPLQALALLLITAGLAGVLLGGETLLTAVVALFRHTDRILVDDTQVQGLFRGALWWLGNTLGALEVVAPGVGILAAAGVSLWLARTVLFGIKRVRWRRVGVGAGIVALVDLVLALSLLGTVPRSALPPVAVPARAQLTAAGLSFRPARGQAAGPVVVDRVFADRTATYVQYHIPNPARDGLPVPALIDDRGRAYDLATCDPCNGYGPSNARYQGQGIGEMMPWRTAQPALAQFAPLDSDAHDAVLHFGDYSGLPVREVVQVPMSLRPWRRLTGGTHPFIVVSSHGVRVNLTRVVRGLSGVVVDYTVDATPAVVPRGSFMAAVSARLTDTRGHPFDPLPSPYGYGCRYVDRGGGHCGPQLALAGVPRGTRLTLTVQSFALYTQQGWMTQHGRPVVGPWRISFVMP